MTPDIRVDEETRENDVRYGIDDCRKRLRSQRSTLRTQHSPPIDVPNGATASAGRVESYAEILATVSMSQGSLSKLVECLLGPAESSRFEASRLEDKGEALIT